MFLFLLDPFGIICDGVSGVLGPWLQQSVGHSGD
jgi:hypothetical protein